MSNACHVIVNPNILVQASSLLQKLKIYQIARLASCLICIWICIMQSDKLGQTLVAKYRRERVCLLFEYWLSCIVRGKKWPIWAWLIVSLSNTVSSLGIYLLAENKSINRNNEFIKNKFLKRPSNGKFCSEMTTTCEIHKRVYSI